MARLQAPNDGVTVRMYRQGHGDCFLLSIPRDGGGEPVYALIDCGYKPGSQAFLPVGNIGQVTKHIEAATNKKLDLVIVTHEHQDHVNGFWKQTKPYFDDFTIRNAWFAWTESPTDRLAKRLRRKHGDQLLRLVEARHRLAALGAAGEDNPVVKRLDALLGMESGGEAEAFDLDAMRLAARDPARSQNKQAMKLIKDKAGRRVKYLNPGESLMVPDTQVRAYILGPPRRESLLTDEDPVGDEGFPGHGMSSVGLSFGAALSDGSGARVSPAFAREYCIPKGSALRRRHFRDHYGREGTGADHRDQVEVPFEAEWRRIDEDWLYAAEALALKLNTGINNTSLVVAFELPQSRRVLLFVGDAQRGNWISWGRQEWRVGSRKVTAAQLLGRTVLYKVGHHGSHNATLHGEEGDNYPNLGWMGTGEFGGDFTAMITAVNEWAMTKNNPPWRHPLPSIRKALQEKCEGRVFQTDRDRPRKPRAVSRTTWRRFTARAEFEDLYFDYTVADD